MIKFVQKLFGKGGARFGSATNYTEFDTSGGMTNTGTQAHTLANLHATTLSVGTAASSSGTAQIGGTSNYLGISAAGAVTDTGTQMHDLNNVHITTLSIGTAASSAGTAQIGGAANYASVAADGAITDTGTQTHDLNVVKIATLAVGGAASSAGTAQVGGASNYLSVSAAGALTDTGTQSHSLNDVTITTLTATNIATQNRYLDLPAFRWDTNSGASCAIDTVTLLGNSASMIVARFITASTPSGPADLSIVSYFRAPTDWLAANAASVQLLTSHTTTGASNAQWTLSASAYGDLEATAGTAVSATKIDTTSGSVANAPHIVDMGALSASGIAAEDLVLVKLSLDATSASNARLESDLYNVRVAYKASTMA